jgi:hypothetical protein
LIFYDLGLLIIVHGLRPGSAGSPKGRCWGE